MTTFTLPEEILGIPLFVPTIYDFFEIDDPGMPDGGPCLIVRGDLNNGYKAFIAAPTFPEPQNFFHTSDVLAGRQWSMSCWLRLENLTTPPPASAIMLGCGTQYVTDPINSKVPLTLYAGPSTNQFGVFRHPLNNVASPIQHQTTHFNGSWEAFQNYWFLFVITEKTEPFSGGSMPQTMYAYMDTYPNAIAGDPDSGGATPTGVYLGPRYLHLGAYHSGGVGRADLWRIGKWAFHDHALTHNDRIEMWKAMMGTSHSYLDDFNRTTLGKNWIATSPGDIVSGQLRGVGASNRVMSWVRCLGSPNHYSEIDVITIGPGSTAYAGVRLGSYLPDITSYYAGGWNHGFSRWDIVNGATLLTSVGSAVPTPPFKVRLEAETDVSNNVILRLYHNDVLILTTTDSSASKRLYECNAGVWLRGNTGVDVFVDNFRCGTLDTVTNYPPPFAATGGYQIFKVPAGVTTLTVDAYGAQGSWDSSGINGGLGGRVKCNVSVIPGEILRVYTGQQAAQVLVAGFGGGGDRGSGTASLLGGSGGGASFIRRDPYGPADTLMAAPGGGGKGANNGGNGGIGGTPVGTAGGLSWGGTGGGGGGGTASAGGALGTSDGGSTGTAGTQGQGGRGQDFSGRSGGGGGGGWYGGGGGGADGSAGGGGGGGSGLSTGVAETIQDGVRTGHGTITITW